MALSDLISRLEHEARSQVQAIEQEALAETRAIEAATEQAIADTTTRHLERERAERQAVQQRELARARREAHARELEARHAHQNPLAQPVDGERRVRSQLVFSNGAHCCLVEIDRRTGLVKILKYVVVHDCGRELNPLIVEGMVHGATAHGIGAALLEEFRYDAQGQLLTSTFMDYLKPTSVDVPLIEVDRLEHPSPVTPLGAKGVAMLDAPVRESSTGS